MGKKIITVVLVLLGVGVLVYPFIGNYYAEKNSSQAIRSYTEAVAELEPSTCEKLWQEANYYNENLTGYPVHDPFIEGTGMAMTDDYLQVLNVDGIMGYIEIPKISVYLPIYHGTSDDVLKKGIGHLEGSTLPVGGSTRHAVLTGHTGLTSAKLFTDLIELEKGDLFYIHILGETLAYRVDQIKVIEPNITDDLKRFSDKDYCTLLTCTPYGVNSFRLLVRGERVEYIPALKEAIVPTTMTTANTLVIQAAGVTTIVMLTLIFITLIVAKRRRRSDIEVEESKVTGGLVRTERAAGMTPADIVADFVAEITGSGSPAGALATASATSGAVVAGTGAGRVSHNSSREPLQVMSMRKKSLVLKVPDWNAMA